MSTSANNTTRKPNEGSFRPGPDARRHTVTTDERRRGYQAAMNSRDARCRVGVPARLRTLPRGSPRC